MKDALMKYETIDAKQIDDLMARQPVREPRDAHDRHEAKPEKEDVSKDKPVDEVQKPADESKKDETNLDDKAE
jgi:cell division protease FtsH